MTHKFTLISNPDKPSDLNRCAYDVPIFGICNRPKSHHVSKEECYRDDTHYCPTFEATLNHSDFNR